MTRKVLRNKSVVKDFLRREKIRKILKDISNIIEEIISKEDGFKEIDKRRLLNSILEILDGFTVEQLKIPRSELVRRIRKVIAVESVFGILNELSPEQIKDFDEIVKRRPLFK
jgi:adenylosuccinate synthase